MKEEGVSKRPTGILFSQPCVSLLPAMKQDVQIRQSEYGRPDPPRKCCLISQQNELTWMTVAANHPPAAWK